MIVVKTAPVARLTDDQLRLYDQIWQPLKQVFLSGITSRLSGRRRPKPGTILTFVILDEEAKVPTDLPARTTLLVRHQMTDKSLNDTDRVVHVLRDMDFGVSDPKRCWDKDTNYIFFTLLVHGHESYFDD